MTDRPLFLYGTLRDPQIRDAALGRVVAQGDLIASWAEDHQAVYFPGQVYPALVRHLGQTAPGLLLTRVTQADHAALDQFEGDQYRRDRLRVITAAGPVAAEAYWPAIDVPATARSWTLEQWLAQHKAEVLTHELALARQVRRRL